MTRDEYRAHDRLRRVAHGQARLIASGLLHLSTHRRQEFAAVDRWRATLYDQRRPHWAETLMRAGELRRAGAWMLAEWLIGRVREQRGPVLP